jgi:glycerophosphoryl diester phosphodiesterase
VKPLVIAHRGASLREPENTLRAFEEAIRCRADWLELDLRSTRDGHVVAIHDEDLSRTTDSKGFVRELNLAEVRRAKAAKGERVPLLAEVLELAAKRIRLYLEIKDASVVGETLKMVRERGCQDDVILASFDLGLMKELGDRRPGMELGVILGTETLNLRVRAREAFPWIALARIRYEMLSIHYRLCYRWLVKQLKQRGKRVVVWTVDEEEMFRTVIARGVDGIVTNAPDRLVEFLNRPRK